MPVILRGGAWVARRIQNNCLRQHCHVLATTFRSHNLAPLKAVAARLLFVLETRSRVLTELHPTEFSAVAAAARLAAYAPSWLRAPEDWWPEAGIGARAQWADLLRHVLARYPSSTFLDPAWEICGPLIHFERDCWCALAQGRSLRKVPGFPESVSGRVLHEALTRGRGRNLTEAIWLAQLRSLGASPSLERAVLSSRVPRELTKHARWMRLAAKFAAGREALAGHFGVVADTLVAVQNHRGPGQVEQLLRLPLETLIRHGIRYVTRLLQANGHLLTEDQVQEAAERAELKRLVEARWAPVLGGVPYGSKFGRIRARATWRIEELSSVDALRAEGEAMGHCVARYAHRCRSGSSAIFSVRHYRADDESYADGVSCATVEVQPRSRRVVQIRGARNRPVNNTVMTIVSEWAAAHELVCGGSQ